MTTHQIVISTLSYILLSFANLFTQNPTDKGPSLNFLNAMTDQDRYLTDQNGGRYGNGKNTPPKAHRDPAMA